ncbi:hypothetical protein GDO81_009087 [Engystomops pustulosus]|uniref:Uncharacterized protein n=1 Tax=Engystomops pustulosus TaxID=76066 RepID=A0AAV7BPN1_ENGPU|nr:hypothetical protein GDO81_009087 [Engystomops pustulosus]
MDRVQHYFYKPLSSNAVGDSTESCRRSHITRTNATFKDDIFYKKPIWYFSLLLTVVVSLVKFCVRWKDLGLLAAVPTPPSPGRTLTYTCI